MDAVILRPGEGERIAAGASTAVMKATAETTGGALSMSEATFPAGMNGPPPRAQVHNGHILRSRRNLAHDGRRSRDRRVCRKLHLGASRRRAHVRQSQRRAGAVPQHQRSWRFGEVPARSCRRDALGDDARGPRLRDDCREVRFRGPDIGLRRISTFYCGDRRGFMKKVPEPSCALIGLEIRSLLLRYTALDIRRPQQERILP